MGSSGLSCFPEQDGVEQSAPLSDGELLKRVCPDYMAMGMTPDEYWHGDPELCVWYRQAHRLRLIQQNEDAWMHGLYTYEALARVSPLFRDFGRNRKPDAYLKEPYDFYPEPNAETNKAKQRQQDKENQGTILAWINRFNSKLRKKEGKANG